MLGNAQRTNDLDAVRSKRVRLTKAKIATLNIGTLTAKSREIADMMMWREMDTLRLQETKLMVGKAGGKLRTSEMG